jgi:anti-sigma B factor antagonist
VPLTFTTEESPDGFVLLKLAGSLDAMTAPELLPTIDHLVEEKRTRITVNLEGLDLIDSSGVAAIVALYKRTRSNGGRVLVTGARDQPLAIFKLLRMDRVFAL